MPAGWRHDLGRLAGSDLLVALRTRRRGRRVSGAGSRLEGTGARVEGWGACRRAPFGSDSDNIRVRLA